MTSKRQIAYVAAVLFLLSSALAQDEKKCAKLSPEDRGWQTTVEECLNIYDTESSLNLVTRAIQLAKSGDYAGSYKQILACQFHSPDAKSGVEYCAGQKAVGDYLSTTMSHEERVVRKTYAKLAFATQLGVLHKDMDKRPGAVTTELARINLQFELSNFSSGDIKNIANKPYDELVSKPMGGDALLITTGTFKYTFNDTEDTIELEAKPRWVQAQDLSSQDWSFPISKAVTMAKDRQDWSRYAAFTSTVSFEGRTKTYNALFLFTWDKLEKREVVLPVDLIAGNSAVDYFVDRSVYPTALLNTKLRSNPSVSEWISTHQIDDESCKPGKGEVCCNLKSLTCGIAADDAKAPIVNPTTTRVGKKVLTPASSIPLLVPASLFRIIKPHAFLGVCEDGNNSWYDTYQASDSAWHVSGSHTLYALFNPSCTYSGDPGACVPTATITAQTRTTDDGIVASFCHVTGSTSVDGRAEGGLSATAASTAVGEARICPACLCAVHISAGPVSFDTDSAWTKTANDSVTCDLRFVSPIIVDTDGRGYHLTSAANGVNFDIQGNGRPLQVAWTEVGSTNAFLALDRNGNGRIDSGRELFGNRTDQPASHDKNGFLALAVFDRPENGGNGDGVLDSHDNVWSQLRLWIDENHDGISQPGELHTLSEFGIESIDLRYKESRYKDAYGNLFRYKGTLDPGKDTETRPAHAIYDVFLLLDN